MERSALDWLFALEQFGIKFGLDNMRALVEALGHPDRAYRTIHIAGTNGKGSVTAMVDTALRAAGHRSARYTSPHLVDLAERFVIDGAPVSPAALEATAGRLRTLVDDLRTSGRLTAPPTFFETTTAIGFELFRQAGVDVAVCEVGLGGRLDATNVLSPMVTAITSIGLDHQQYLGSTLGEIAGEKAGIIKPGVPVVVGELPAEAADPIAQVARERGAPLLRAMDGVTIVDEGRERSGGRRIRLKTPRHDYGTGVGEALPIDLGLAGAHQVGNAVVAVRLLETMDDLGLRVPPEAIVRGLTDVQWPGRLEHRRLADGRDVLLDAAHNPEGAQALADYLSSEYETPPPMVFAAMKDKDTRDMLRILAPHVSALVLTRALTPRAADPHDLAAVARTAGVACPVTIEPILERALATAWAASPSIVVAGSIFLLGDVMKAYGWS